MVACGERGEGFLPVLLDCRYLCAGVPLWRKKGTAPVQVLGESNWILGLKVFVECFSPTGIFGVRLSNLMHFVRYWAHGYRERRVP